MTCQSAAICRRPSWHCQPLHSLHCLGHNNETKCSNGMCIDNAYYCNAKKKKKKVVENKIQLFNVCKSSSSCSMSELAQLWEQQNVGVRSKKSNNETKILNISSNHTYNNQFWTPPFPSIEFLLCPFKLNHIFVLFNPVERRTQQDVKHC